MHIDKVKNLDEQILLETETADILNGKTEASTFQGNLHELPARVSIIINAKSKSNSIITARPNNQASTALRLPQYQLPKFKGECIQWKTVGTNLNQSCIINK